MSGWLAVGVLLAVFAALDGAFAGFRASCGRTGLIDHTLNDRRGAKRGLILSAGFLVPISVAICIDAATSATTLDAYHDAGRTMLWIFAPYGVLVLAALAAYLTLDWRRRFLASVLILGPFTLIRPLVVVSAVVAVGYTNDHATVLLSAVAAGVAVLAVEPLTGRLWYSQFDVA